ncbi:hypothetical protein MAR_031219 [Mya arenaria]|uniref:Uncharacterized protein n=1 Tax=Mya arenaria TaxID=6604 RepID=A0ABY7F3A9_MYAAR|nr:hypothetical protein MAR_031219 [Mya arenaria]
MRQIFLHGILKKSSFGNVSFVFVGDEAIWEKEHELSQILGLIRPVKRTMKLHAVAGNRMSSVLVNETSCYCAHCLSGERCSTCREEPIRKRNPVAVETALIDNHTEPEQHVATVAVEHVLVENQTEPNNIVDDYVDVVYETGWYVGKVVDIDKEDDEIEISFMVRKNELYQWPRRTDKTWIGKGDVLNVIQPPIGTGKTKTMFKLADSDHDKCTQLYANRI